MFLGQENILNLRDYIYLKYIHEEKWGNLNKKMKTNLIKISRK